MPWRQMVDARAAVDQHHCQVTGDHCRVVITPGAHPAQRLAQRVGQTDAVGDLDRQRQPRAALDPTPVTADHEPARTLATLHHLGDLLYWDCDR
jgi:hypothetical protein